MKNEPAWTDIVAVQAHAETIVVEEAFAQLLAGSLGRQIALYELLPSGRHDMLLPHSVEGMHTKRYWQLDALGAEPLCFSLDNEHNSLLYVLKSSSALPRQALQEGVLRGLSHDYGNSLAAVMGFSEIASFYADNASPALCSALENVRKACDYAMEGLTWSRVVAGRSELTQECFDIVTAVQQWIQELQHDGTVSIQCSCDASFRERARTVVADKNLLHKAVGELVTNALRASRNVPSASVDIHIMKDNATARRSGQGLCLCIRDNGVGMAPRTLARLGELYWQGGEFTEGKGKGFAFARGVAHAHGGMLDIVTALGVGTTAFLVIPFVE